MDDSQDLRVRLRPGLKQQLEKVLDAKKTTQQAAVNELVAWFVTQSDILQSIILGQLTKESWADVADIVHKQLKSGSSGLKGPR